MQPKSLELKSAVSPEQLTAFRNKLKQQIGDKNFSLWFEQPSRFALQNETFFVRTASPFELSWMQRQFGKSLSYAAQQAFGPSASIELTVRPDLLEQNDPQGDDLRRKPSPTSRESAAPNSSRKANSLQTSRNTTRRTLLDFVFGEENELAFAASVRVCEQPGERYNPLFLYGDIGIGKSHLLDGIYWETRRKHPSLNVMKMTAETFANYFTQALSQRKLPEFRFRMRSADVLLVDDVDFLDGKKVIQEEFLHTFKVLEDSRKQMVFTADRHPRLFLKSREELTSRLGSGMLARLEIPGEETRRNIVSHKVKSLGLNLSEEIQQYVSKRFSRTVRELEGALNCLDHFSRCASSPLTLSSARRQLSDLEQDCRKLIHLSDIEECVCRFFGLAPEELKSSCKSKQVSHPRMLAMYLARKLTHSPYSAIGYHFGGRKHNTAKSAEQKVESWLQSETPLRIASREWAVSDVIGSLERELQAC